MSMSIVDDNFSRSRCWKEVLGGLCELRKAGHNFSFLVEADLAAAKIPEFPEMLAEAGCSAIFMGVESVNEENLKAVGKHQNRAEEYAAVCSAFRAHGINIHAAYLIGFPNDTPESVAKDIETLKKLGFSLVSFFILGPCPGSDDFARMHREGTWMDGDWDRFDTIHSVMEHPSMTHGELEGVYWNALRKFYTRKQMIVILKKATPESYKSTFLGLILWRWMTFAEKLHPMIGGFYRVRRFWDRKPSAPHISRSGHWFGEFRRHLRYFFCIIREYFIVQEVYFETRWLPRIGKLSKDFPNIADAIKAQRERVKVAGEAWLEKRAMSGWFSRTFGRSAHRAWLNAFWCRYGHHRWKLLSPHKWHWQFKAIPYVITEIVYATRFGWKLVQAMSSEKL